jgi:hypothetical protein
MCNTNESLVAIKTCLPANPSVKFDDTKGEVLGINPNLPQTNAFSAFGYIPLKIPKSYFKSDYREGNNPAPSSPFLADLNKIALGTDATSSTFEKEMITLLLKREFGARYRTEQESYTVKEPKTVQVVTSGVTYNNTIQEDVQKFAPVDMLADQRLNDVVAKLMEFDTNTISGKKYRVWTLTVSVNTFGKAIVNYEKQATAVVPKDPQFMIVEEYKVASFLGQYGLGRVLSTFSLLPGEKTTIRMKTYKEIQSVRTQSENILDSQSKESIDEMERLAQEEKGSTSSNTNTKAANLGFSLSGIPLFGGLLGLSGGASTNNTNVRTTNAQSLSKALDKHVNKSNSNRQIQINTSTTESSKSIDENSTEREIVNVNKSRVLNFIFRQLQQEFVNITYLANIKIAFHTGTQDSLRVVSLEELSDLLNEVVDVSVYADNRTDVEKELLKHYVRVKNHNNELKNFIQQAEDKLFFPTKDDLLTESVKYWRKADIKDKYSKDGVNATVDGIILNVQKTTLKTSSVLVEALLGQADALDCFNLQIQDSESQKGYMELQERAKRLTIEENRAANEHDKVAAEVEKLEAERAKIAAEAALITNVIGSADGAAKVELAKEMYSKCCPNGTTPHLIP